MRAQRCGGIPLDTADGCLRYSANRSTHKENFMALRPLVAAAASALLVIGCASPSVDESGNTGWSAAELNSALNAPSRPQADRERDANRKPAELVTLFGVQKGMTVLDLIASGGYFTEVLSIAVGPTGKVYAQNPPAFLQFRDGMYDKAIGERLADDRLPNVVRVDADLPAASIIPPGSVDVAVTALNFHDIYNRDAAAGVAFLKNVHSTLKPGGVLGLIDHAGNTGADNAKLHRMPKQQAIEAAQQAGFVVDKDSDLLANASDDHTKGPFDPALRGKTDQFVLVLRKPK
jgi:predicted methyltransferase